MQFPLWLCWYCDLVFTFTTASTDKMRLPGRLRIYWQNYLSGGVGVGQECSRPPNCLDPDPDKKWKMEHPSMFFPLSLITYQGQIWILSQWRQQFSQDMSPVRHSHPVANHRAVGGNRAERLRAGNEPRTFLLQCACVHSEAVNTQTERNTVD